MEQFLRTSLVLGSEAVEKLKNKRVAVFGIGGVGGYVAEALARSGVGAIDLIDNDTVSLSNINRQIIALHSTVGRLKTDVMEERILDICPDIKVTKHNLFFMPETSGEIDFSQFDYVVDAIDTVSGKLEIIRLAKENGVPVISSMGTGNKLSPLEFKIADISKTKVCPLAKAMRLELKKRGIKNVKVLYSEEDGVMLRIGGKGPYAISANSAEAMTKMAKLIEKDRYMAIIRPL
ncbi:MAG: tRNA threonylcarbamoyladenosine dehydratase, partial [Clostridia bacterium]|nr:tRNA threonylcarbamoyladenosine dehydratase [Clostridia bacterium]